MCQCHGLTVPQLHANMAFVRAQDQAAEQKERAAIAVAEHAIANARTIGMVAAQPLVSDGSACTVPHALVVARSSYISPGGGEGTHHASRHPPPSGGSASTGRR